MSDTRDDKPMTLKEVSDYLRYKEKTVVKLAQEGVLPGRKHNKEWRFITSEIKSLGLKPRK